MKQLKDFPDYYITEDAQIISKRCKREKKLKQCIDGFGYFCVGLRSNNKTKTKRIHTLMMINYGTEPPLDMINPTVDHIDGNKLNNHIDNLQWLSNKDNAYKSAQSRIKKYTIQKKNGDVFIVKNITSWCKDNNLDKSSLLRSYNKGWWHKDYKIITKQD